MPTSAIVVLLVAVSASLAGVFLIQDPSSAPSPDERTVTELSPLALDDNLPSWNPAVECGAKRLTIADVLGPTYPSETLVGTPYQRTATEGGVFHQRALSPLCTITNITGQAKATFVEIDGVYLSAWYVQPIECSNHYKGVNGGAPYPGGVTLCDSQGQIYTLGTSAGFMQMEIDQDWMARTYCGPGHPPCDNVTLGAWVSSGEISLDVQGFVYWDGENWDLHPATGVRLSTGLQATVEPASLQTTQNYSASATVRIFGDVSGPVSLSVSGCPADTTCTVSPSGGPTRFTSTLVVNTTPMSPPGTYVLSITATSGSLTTPVPLPLTIADRVSLAFRRGDGGGFSETDDAYIQSGAPTTNYGAETKLFVDAKDCIKAYPGSVCKSLIQFPAILGPAPGQIPVGSRIVNATLELMVTNIGVTEDAYQITESWSESAATWNSFTPPGLPGTRTPKITFPPTHVGRFSVNITPINQRWANGDANEGILLTSTNGDGVDYNASESVRDRPSLKVQFVPPPSSLVLAYDMETLTPDGRMEDRSGSGNSGVMTGTTDVPWGVGHSREFNGNNPDSIRVTPGPTASFEFTYAFWIFPHEGGVGGGFSRIASRDSDRFEVAIDGATGEILFYDGTWKDTATSVRIGAWSHIALAWNGTSVQTFKNGLPSSTVAGGRPLSGNQFFGSRWTGSEGFHGVIDELFLFDRRIADSEIASLASVTPIIDQSGPVLWFDMENLTADGRMKDLSGHGNHGNLSGTTDVPWGVGHSRAFNSNHPDVITVSPGPTAATGFTYAFWLFPQSGFGGPFSRIASRSNDNFEIGFDPGSGAISFFDGSWK